MDIRLGCFIFHYQDKPFYVTGTLLQGQKLLKVAFTTTASVPFQTIVSDSGGTERVDRVVVLSRVPSSHAGSQEGLGWAWRREESHPSCSLSLRFVCILFLLQSRGWPDSSSFQPFEGFPEGGGSPASPPSRPRARPCRLSEARASGASPWFWVHYSSPRPHPISSIGTCF